MCVRFLCLDYEEDDHLCVCVFVCVCVCACVCVCMLSVSLFVRAFRLPVAENPKGGQLDRWLFERTRVNRGQNNTFKDQVKK